jgi:hypothetical protein
MSSVIDISYKGSPMSDIEAIECRFATYSRSTEEGDYSDYHLIKEIVHYKNGVTAPNLRSVIDYKRNFFITKKGMQNHKDKKEWEHIENLNEFKSTQSDLTRSVAAALGTPWFKGNLKKLQASPYVYGTDISSTAMIKQSYADKWTKRTKYSVAVFDTETDVVHGTGEIVMATVSYKTRLITVIQRKFLTGQSNAVQRIRDIANVILEKYIKERNIQIEIAVVDKEIDIVKLTMAKAHEWMPDFLAVWNIEFDMDKIISACERANVNIADILNDPKVPARYRTFNFKKGPAKKTTASGLTMSIPPAARWHSVTSPASFTWIDAMCTYKHVRTGEPEEPSYALDSILQLKAGITKLKFEQTKEYTGLMWHQVMQEKYPLEYVVYNMFDCISMEVLDEITNDLSLSLPTFTGCSDFSDFKSQPKRTSDKLHYFCLNNDRVVGSVSSEMTTELDSLTPELSGWIKSV